MENPIVSKIRIHPVKALDPVELSEAEIGIHSLKNDRAFAMVAEDGRYINGKRTGRVNQLLAEYDLQNQLITLSERGSTDKATFELSERNDKLINYLSDFFETKLSLFQREKGELMDMPQSSSITVVSKASLESLHQDLNYHSLEDLRLRFRTNLEIDGVDAFWEEKLFGTPGFGFRFSVGDVEMVGISPRARCNVPPKNPYSGELDKTFIKRMMDSRQKSLPGDSLLPEHGNPYHLTVNTYISENQKGKTIKIGDPIKIIEAVKFG